jgi:phenylpropionate dioxygenase-like ring-hydroxylating dioxygenase large terminal subunit
VNSCRHRGNAVCRAEEGHATSFMCTYHGWTYDLQGRLVGVPGFKEVYHEELDRESWGLIRAGKVASYGGLIFATMDPEAPELMDYLGPVGRLTIDYFNQTDGKRHMGISKWSVGCNWKFAVDNIWDWYHVSFTHASAGMADNRRGAPNYVARWSPFRRQREVVAMGEYGHCIGGAGHLADDPISISNLPQEKRDALGPVGRKMDGFGGIFPTLWISSNSIEWRVPVSATRTEMWHMNFAKRLRSSGVGPSAMFDMDDAENWGMSTVGTQGVVSRRYPLNYAMALGKSEVTEIEGGPPHIDSTNWTEHGQRWHYRNWAHWLTAKSWQDLEASHPAVPTGVV